MVEDSIYLKTDIYVKKEDIYSAMFVQKNYNINVQTQLRL